MKPAGYLISQINTALIIGAKGEISAAIKPKIVIGPTAGAANKLAITLIGEIYPESETKTGEQKTIAAMGGASACASFSGVKRASFSTTRGANKSRPAVAITERAKPASRACHGSPTTTAAIAKPSAGS